MKKLLVCFIVVLLTGCASQSMNRQSSNISFRVPLFDNSRLYTNLSTYKNSNGEYDTDFLDCTLWSAVAESTSEYCETGDMIGIKGRLQTRVVETPEGTKRKKTEIIAEKVTFLTSNPQRRKSESSVEELSEDQEEKVEE